MARGPKPNKGWFFTGQRPGDRTVEQQMRGLDPLLAQVPGRTVLDIGCAEGLISFELLKAGAASVEGVEIVASHVEIANTLGSDWPGQAAFRVLDANDYAPQPSSYDIVIMLALLHKLRHPDAACSRFAAAARELCVIRVPPGHGCKIVDARSQNVPYPLEPLMEEQGFYMEDMLLGPFDEPTYFFRRG